MSRPVTLFTGQWADLDIDTMCQQAKSFGYDGLELACWGDHFEVAKADERFFIATQRYLQAMSQAVGGKREEIAAEFAILKKEIARWKSRDQGADAAAETQL